MRSWSVTRFRGMISTQPGSQPLASFKVLSLEESHPIVHTSVGNNVGKFRLIVMKLTNLPST